MISKNSFEEKPITAPHKSEKKMREILERKLDRSMEAKKTNENCVQVFDFLSL